MTNTALITLPSPTLDRYGATSRCLLRLRENSGQAPLAEEIFLTRYREKFPQWAEHPGELDVSGLCEMARELHLAPGGILATRAYDEALRLHRFGCSLLVATERVPVPVTGSDQPSAHMLLLEQMDEEGFLLWCPFPSGASDLLPRADRIWWDRWHCIAFVLHPTSRAPARGT